MGWDRGGGDKRLKDCSVDYFNFSFYVLKKYLLFVNVLKKKIGYGAPHPPFWNYSNERGWISKTLQKVNFNDLHYCVISKYNLIWRFLHRNNFHMKNCTFLILLCSQIYLISSVIEQRFLFYSSLASFFSCIFFFSRFFISFSFAFSFFLLSLSCSFSPAFRCFFLFSCSK